MAFALSRAVSFLCSVAYDQNWADKENGWTRWQKKRMGVKQWTM